MAAEVESEHAAPEAHYETPMLTVQGSFEVLTQQDVDGDRFDMSFNAGDPIPDAFAS